VSLRGMSQIAMCQKKHAMRFVGVGIEGNMLLVLPHEAFRGQAAVKTLQHHRCEHVAPASKGGPTFHNLFKRAPRVCTRGGEGAEVLKFKKELRQSLGHLRSPALLQYISITEFNCYTHLAHDNWPHLCFAAKLAL